MRQYRQEDRLERIKKFSCMREMLEKVYMLETVENRETVQRVEKK